MKIIPIFCCMLFLTLCSAKGQYGRYRLYPKLSDMIADQGIAQTITTLDSILQIYFNSPYDTLTKEFIWYNDKSGFLHKRESAISAINYSPFELPSSYCTVFMRAYYWMWLISENMISTDFSQMNPSKFTWGTFHYRNGYMIYDYHISDESREKYKKGIGVEYITVNININDSVGNGLMPNFDKLGLEKFLSQNSTKREIDSSIGKFPNYLSFGLKIIPIQDFKEILPDIIEQYTQWIKVVKTEGLTVARKKKIALLPNGYTWKVYE